MRPPAPEFGPRSPVLREPPTPSLPTAGAALKKASDVPVSARGLNEPKVKAEAAGTWVHSPLPPRPPVPPRPALPPMPPLPAGACMPAQPQDARSHFARQGQGESAGAMPAKAPAMGMEEFPATGDLPLHAQSHDQLHDVDTEPAGKTRDSAEEVAAPGFQSPLPRRLPELPKPPMPSNPPLPSVVAKPPAAHTQSDEQVGAASPKATGAAQIQVDDALLRSNVDLHDPDTEHEGNESASTEKAATPGFPARLPPGAPALPKPALPSNPPLPKLVPKPPAAQSQFEEQEGATSVEMTRETPRPPESKLATSIAAAPAAGDPLSRSRGHVPNDNAGEGSADKELAKDAPGLQLPSPIRPHAPQKQPLPLTPRIATVLPVVPVLQTIGRHRIAQPAEVLAAATDAAMAAADWLQALSACNNANDVAAEACAALMHEKVRKVFPSHTVSSFGGVANRDADGIDSRSDWVWSICAEAQSGNEGRPSALSLYASMQGTETKVGIIYDPSRDELFSAVSGWGAELNGRRLQVARLASLGQAIVSAEPTQEAATARPCLCALCALGTATAGLRILGSSSLSLAWVACARVGAFYTMGNTTMLEAGVLLVAEAGGHVTDGLGQALLSGSLREASAAGRSLCATCGDPVHSQLINVLRQNDATGPTMR